jgi:hypothetical protein
MMTSGAKWMCVLLPVGAGLLVGVCSWDLTAGLLMGWCSAVWIAADIVLGDRS